MVLSKNRNQFISQMNLEQKEFEKIRTLLHEYCGIYLHEGKEALVRARLMKRIRALNLGSFREYMDFLESDDSGAEFVSLVDVLTTNKTSFFRESQHFDFLRKEVIPRLNGREVKWWSAGCSTGEEPVSCAITLLEETAGAVPPVKILATDISTEVLHVAKNGIYTADKLTGMPDFIREKYFNPGRNGLWKIEQFIREMIKYGRINLPEPWPLSGPFQIIMCRNVMIYFNRKTQQELVNRFYNILEPGGYLFLGHSESAAEGEHQFVNVLPAVYQKPT